METWRPVPGFEASYEVSDLGRVRSVSRRVTTSAGWTRSQRGRVLSPSTPRGKHYSTVHLGRAATRSVHQLVMLAFVGPCPPGLEVCHGNGDRSDNRLANLRYGTSSENKLDAVAHGTSFQTAKTHCPRGHALCAHNRVAAEWKRGRRKCLACSRATARRTHARRAGVPEPDMQLLSDELRVACECGTV